MCKDNNSKNYINNKEKTDFGKLLYKLYDEGINEIHDGKAITVKGKKDYENNPVEIEDVSGLIERSSIPRRNLDEVDAAKGFYWKKKREDNTYCKLAIIFPEDREDEKYDYWMLIRLLYLTAEAMCDKFSSWYITRGQTAAVKRAREIVIGLELMNSTKGNTLTNDGLETYKDKEDERITKEAKSSFKQSEDLLGDDLIALFQHETTSGKVEESNDENSLFESGQNYDSSLDKSRGAGIALSEMRSMVAEQSIPEETGDERKAKRYKDEYMKSSLRPDVERINNGTEWLKKEIEKVENNSAVVTEEQQGSPWRRYCTYWNKYFHGFAVSRLGEQGGQYESKSDQDLASVQGILRFVVQQDSREYSIDNFVEMILGRYILLWEQSYTKRGAKNRFTRLALLKRQLCDDWIKDTMQINCENILREDQTDVYKEMIAYLEERADEENGFKHAIEFISNTVGVDIDIDSIIDRDVLVTADDVDRLKRNMDNQQDFVMGVLRSLHGE